MILRFSTFDLNGVPQGIAFNTENKMFSYNMEVWAVESVPVSIINLAKIDRKIIMDNYYYTDNTEEFYKGKKE